MKLSFLKAAFENRADFNELIEAVLTCGAEAALAPHLRPLLIAAAFERLYGKALVLVKDEAEAERLFGELKNYLPEESLVHFPAQEILPLERVDSNPELSALRYLALEKMRAKERILAIASLKAALFDISYMETGLSRGLMIETELEVDLYDLAARLVELGYERLVKVEDKGKFSLRGGIVDIFPPHLNEPIRLEFLGDTIESIRSFDLASQLSIEEVQEVAILPCRESILSKEDAFEILSRLKLVKEKPGWLVDEITKLEAEEGAAPIMTLAHLLIRDAKTAIDFLGKDPFLILSDPSLLKAEEKRLAFSKEHLMEDNEVGPVIQLIKGDLFEDTERIKKRAGRLLSLNRVAADESGPSFAFNSDGIDPILGDMERLKGFLESTGGLKVIALPTRGQLERMAEIVQGFGLEPKEKFTSFSGSGPLLIQADLGCGFQLDQPPVTVLGESDIFIKIRSPRQGRQTTSSQGRLELSEIKPNDLIVHESQGIGRFLGLTREEVGGVVREYVLLEYKGGDRLYVPLEQTGQITKYIGAQGEATALSKLGMKDWAKVKARVKKAVKKLAFDLLSLYAYRTGAQGYAFSKDTPWQAEMEEAFPFEETADQLAAIEEVKLDMEMARPMDRLICGDVGYGKTEVALRAAFKAALDGRQVLVLVPTTILAQQHFFTFKERFAPFPIKVELLSRFKKKAEEKKILFDLEAGAIDVIIGTHRLLSKDVIFKDLGLVVIDEEQRFGVGSKEHFKNLRKNVDVLTMSATPIPRTLQMSLGGVRDLSVINTPPEDRFPIKTRVSAYNEDLIRAAVKRELERGGQVFYVHNRIATIELAALRLREILPGVRVGVAHGQMAESELERVMSGFLEGEYDLLLSTTIIESGIDIPRANTIIVEMAERLGLAQMYQLKGRVGRSHHLAYAYFFSSRELAGEEAQKRLEAIEEFTELGSGIKIALRDLEIRGAGNILGAEQHGQMESVGFELYNQLLKEAVLELKGEELPKDISKVKIDLPVSGFIPKDYLEDESLRIEAYRRIARAESASQLKEVEAGLKDRFGSFGREVEALFATARIRLLAISARVDSISYDGKRFILSMASLGSEELRALGAGRKEASIDYRPSSKSLILPTSLRGEEIFIYLNKLLDDIIKNRKTKETEELT